MQIKGIVTFFKYIDIVNEKIGKYISLLLIIVMFVIGTATISRYFFGKPLPIIWPFIRQIFGVLVLLGAPYAMLHDKHIRVEILYDFFPSWLKKISNIVSLMFFLSFTGAIIWQGIKMAKLSFMLKEVSQQSALIPIYPFKMFLPIATILFLFQGIAYFLKKDEPNDDFD